MLSETEYVTDDFFTDFQNILHKLSPSQNEGKDPCHNLGNERCSWEYLTNIKEKIRIRATTSRYERHILGQGSQGSFMAGVHTNFNLLAVTT